MFATALIVLIVTTLPYLYGYWSAPADKQFMGVIYNVSDHMQYFSWFREFSHANLAANKLTPEPNKPIFFNLLWWGMARIGGVLGIECGHVSDAALGGDDPLPVAALSDVELVLC